ncbi:DUF2059 domain-containing protein [Sorangium sp. So ce131]|uniref:DUF2059 domain-containing protein n=1 Tax=Sorangium sp. So ce131 TaxID=3133282 RepID=UPI003F63546F
MQWNVEVYASRLTADELKELIKFYGTPLGRSRRSSFRRSWIRRVPADAAAMKKAGLQ